MMPTSNEGVRGTILTIVLAAIALGAVLVPGQRAIRGEQEAIRRDITGLAERMARLEGLFDGYIRSEQATANSQ